MASPHTIHGGSHATLSLDPTEHAAAQQALASLNSGLSSGYLGVQPSTNVTEPESVHAGSGNVTLIGGSQAETSMGGHGFTTIAIGAGDNTVPGAQPSVFQFNASLSGGVHLITDFTEGSDKLQLVGYDTASAFAHAHVVGGNTVITLDGGKTEIVLNGFANLHKTDFIK